VFGVGGVFLCSRSLSILLAGVFSLHNSRIRVHVGISPPHPGGLSFDFLSPYTPAPGVTLGPFPFSPSLGSGALTFFMPPTPPPIVPRCAISFPRPSLRLYRTFYHFRILPPPFRRGRSPLLFFVASSSFYFFTSAPGIYPLPHLSSFAQYLGGPSSLPCHFRLRALRGVLLFSSTPSFVPAIAQAGAFFFLYPPLGHHVTPSLLPSRSAGVLLSGSPQPCSCRRGVAAMVFFPPLFSKFSSTGGGLHLSPRRQPRGELGNSPRFFCYSLPESGVLYMSFSPYSSGERGGGYSFIRRGGAQMSRLGLLGWVGGDLP